MGFGGQVHGEDGHLGVIRVELVAKDLSDHQGPSVVGKRRGQCPKEWEASMLLGCPT